MIRKQSSIRHLILILVIVFYFKNVWGTIYYVDNVDGDDNNSGDSISLPWQTIAKINHNTFKSGDSILFKRDQIWREQLIVPSSGSSVAHITFGSFGYGNRPIISGADDITANKYKWTISNNGMNEYYLETIQGGNPGITEPLLLWMDQINLTKGNAGSLTDHEWAWTDNDDLGFKTVYIRDDTGDPDISAVLIEAGTRDIAIRIGDKSYITIEALEVRQSNANWGGLVHLYDSHHIIFKNCLIHDAHYVPFYMFHSSGNPPEYNIIDSCIIYGCQRTDSPYSSVVKLHDCHHNVIKNCTIYEGSNPSYADVIFLYQSDHNLIENNNVSGPAGNLLYIKESSDFNIVRYNRFHDSMGGMGIQIRVNSNGNKIYYNVIYNLAGGPAIQSDGDVPIDGTQIFNNTIYVTGNNRNGISIHNTNTNCEVKNNIVCVGEYSFALHIHENSVSGTISDYNLFRNKAGMLISWNGNKYTMSTFSEYQSQSGQDLHSIKTDPYFFDPEQNNFHLRPSSPCIDLGIDVSLSVDIEGKRIPRGKAIDLGAFEYLSISPPQNVQLSEP